MSIYKMKRYEPAEVFKFPSYNMSFASIFTDSQGLGIPLISS